MSPRTQRAFTLVEMLVVIGIIGILAALLLPAVMRAMTTARNTAISLEINQIASAIEAYKQDKGDYPPNFRDSSIVLRHIRKCYPKADSAYVQNFVNYACGVTNTTSFIDEGEAIVFWLSMTDSDPRYPFLSYYNPGGNPAPTAAPKKYLDIDDVRKEVYNTGEEQLNIKDVGSFYDVQAYKAKYSKDTDYIYIDSRSYPTFTNFSVTNPPFAYSEDNSKNFVRPYGTSSSTKGVNPTTFQVLCAGQDGEWGELVSAVKIVETGKNYDTTGGDSDNLANFSNGRPLSDMIK